MVALAPTACKHRVSGTLSLPSRGSFHLSLTVLYAIGHQVVFSLGGWAPRIPTGLLVSCGTLDTRLLQHISTTGLLPSLVGSSKPLRLYAASILQVLTPFVRRQSVWALSRSLAATKKIDVSFFSSGYLDVSVHRVPSVTLCIHVTVMAHYRHRVSPFGYPWIYRLFAAPHGFSQLTTSFFGSWCQGIRPMLLLA